MDSMLSIGAKVDKRTVKDLQESIDKILGSNAGDTIKIKALGIITRVFSVNDVTVQSCNFTNVPQNTDEEQAKAQAIGEALRAKLDAEAGSDEDLA